MKKTIAFILAIILCVGLCACNEKTQTNDTAPTDDTTPTETPIIESGMKIDALYEIFSAPEEDYQETIIGSNTKEFSFRNDEYYTQGILSGDNVIEFSWTIPNVYAETRDEFGRVLQTDFFEMPKDDYGAWQAVFFITCCHMIVGGDGHVENGDAVSAILEGTEIKTIDWVITAELDKVEDTVIIHAKYRN